MSSNIIANRYAKAVIKTLDSDPSLADKALSFFSMCEEMFALAETKNILKSPVMPPDLKRALLVYAAEKSGATKEFSNFSSQVVEAGRTSLLPEISKAFKQMLADKRGLAVATATTAEPISEGLKSELTASLEKVFKKKITLKNEVDKKVLGGVVVNIGNYTIDLSLKSRLNSVADFAQR